MPKDNKALFNSQLKLIKPKDGEFKEVSGFIDRVNSLLKKAELRAVCVAGGSYAKGTILKKDFDIDLFVRFDYSYNGKDISKLLGSALKSLKPELVHGSRDYFQLRKKNILFEIIPVLKIDDYKKAVNVTDMSPLHVGYAKKHFDKKKLLADEVRLAKQFCKGICVYGAESYIRGFSGHVLDLLVIYYGGFEKLLMQASLWGERVVIDIERHWKDPLKALNTSKTISPLVIVDPIQPDRNAAAAVSLEKFHLFKESARAFLHEPSADFFKVKKLNISELKKKSKGHLLFLVEAVPVEGKDDVVGTKLLKCHELFQKRLLENDFKLLESGWQFSEKTIMFYIVKREVLSKNVFLHGPPVHDSVNCDAFRAKHKKVVERKGVLYAEEKRQFLTPHKLFKCLLKDEYVLEKVKRIRLL